MKPIPFIIAAVLGITLAWFMGWLKPQPSGKTWSDEPPLNTNAPRVCAWHNLPEDTNEKKAYKNGVNANYSWRVVLGREDWKIHSDISELVVDVCKICGRATRLLIHLTNDYPMQWNRFSWPKPTNAVTTWRWLAETSAVTTPAEFTNHLSFEQMAELLCKHRGHVWGDNPSYYPFYESNPSRSRKCHVCGLIQSQQPGEWR